MSRTSRGPTALHFTAIVLTMATVLLIAVAFLFYRDGQEMRAAVARAEAEREKLTEQVRDQDDSIMVLKDVLGYRQAAVGGTDDQDPSTVSAATSTGRWVVTRPARGYRLGRL